MHLRPVCNLINTFPFLVKLHTFAYLADNIHPCLDAYHIQLGTIPVPGIDGDGLQTEELLG